MASSTASSAQLLTHLDRDGFVHIPQAFSEKALDSYRLAASDAIKLARAGGWPYIRTLPKQFPPWSGDVSNGIWGVQHLLHPNMPNRDVFAESYFNDKIVDIVTSLLRCERHDLVLELYNMLVRPDHDFALRWHRDDIAPGVDAGEELQRLEQPLMHAQWNLALHEDTSLIVVPGSHKRARTDMERNADPYEDDMPGQKVVKMSPGDILFYNNNILHRGVYSSKTERMTLHGSMGMSGGDTARARNILQHGIGSWAESANFDALPDGMASLAKGMQSRLLELGSGQDLGYSQDVREIRSV